ncbi:MAG: ATP-binding cassette domain-containing protein [Verrucomicrobiales bacterium]
MITLDNIGWRTGNFELKGISWVIPANRYVVLMGATGCGKTTLLEIICGLRQPQFGRIWRQNLDITRQPPWERGIGYLPQDIALFPGHSVRDQIGFSLKMKRRPPKEIALKTNELACSMGIDHLLDRQPAGLSGGEQQRIALARALAADPDVLLLDEPLSALDEERRGELSQLLSEVQRRLGLTVIHVTHSRGEAATLADLVYRLTDGSLKEETGPPA